MARTPTGNSFGARATIEVASRSVSLYSLPRVAEQAGAPLDRLPYCVRVLLENLARNEDGRIVTAEDVATVARWEAQREDREIAFLPARVLLQDFTGVPAVVDLAAMRDAMRRLGGPPERINPRIPADLVIDHSVQVDFAGSAQALQRNAELEYQRNRERYTFLRWAQQSLSGFRVVPPETGIVHQVNLEYLARVVWVRSVEGETLAFPDSLVGTDSHTTMINGLGVFGWGVGGIEAEAVMLGQPYYILVPRVVGMRLTGQLAPGVTATDLVLTATQVLRGHGVVGKMVEFHGPGLADLALADRATLANMAPEYGATMGFFPVDERTLEYLRMTGREEEHVALVEAYAKEQGLFRSDSAPEPCYDEVVELDLSKVEPSLAGPRRPQDRVALRDVGASFRRAFVEVWGRPAEALPSGGERGLDHGAVVIAAITSCTNTSNPGVMLGAGLLARKAVERGLSVPPWVKTSLAPGSRAVTEYLRDTGLLADLEKLGFHVVGYGCTTCIGNSGPLPEAVAQAIRDRNLVVASVLSGNRNFEGRINPLTMANYLASPPLVVAFALAGTVLVDLEEEPVGTDSEGRPVRLRELWPDAQEVREAVARALRPEMFVRQYANVFEGDARWQALPAPQSELYPWDPASTYIKSPPFFDGVTAKPEPLRDIVAARVLCLLGDSVTTDHISPAGAIPVDSPAGRYLIEQGVRPEDFNSYGSRRGNHEVMVRGTFANVRLRNLLVPGVEGGWTVHLPDGERMWVYEAAMRYRDEGVPLLVIAGKEYGTGSSRDWAAKGTHLLGVRAVVAESFERIHRSNLIGMGVLPLQFREGENRETLGLSGRELYTIRGIAGGLRPRQELEVEASSEEGRRTFRVVARVDSPVEVEYYEHGGILPAVLRQLLKA